MKQLYSARNGLDAHDLRLFLESQGIVAKVFGDTNALESIFAFTPASAPGVFVDEADVARATELLEQFQEHSFERPAQATWKCPSCGETIEAQFDVCWNCETPRGNEPIVPSASVTTSPAVVAPHETTQLSGGIPSDAGEPKAQPVAQTMWMSQTDRELWLEVCAVVAIRWFPGFAHGVVDLWFPPEPIAPIFAGDAIISILQRISGIVLVLYIIYRSGEHWRTFGLRKWRPVIDLSLCVVIVGLYFLAMFFCFDFLRALLGPHAFAASKSLAGVSPSPTGVVDKVTVCGSLLVSAFSEELFYRGYLIHRFSHLLKSYWKAILLSSLFFGFAHIYGGWHHVFTSFVGGIVLGCAYSMVRRLWPTFFAHALFNIIIASR